MKNKRKKITCDCCNTILSQSSKGYFDDRYGAPGRYSIYTCKYCGFGKTYPGLRKSSIGKFYANYYPISKSTPKEVLNSIRSLTNLKKWLTGTDNIAHEYANQGEDVLDVGSASGTSLIEIERIGAHAYGVEPDPNGKRLARSLKLRVYTGFITDNPFPSNKFDLISASQVIEHEPDPYKFLVAMRRKLKKDGRIILSFPNYLALYRKIFGKRWIHYHIPYHLNFFTRKALEIMAKRAGLDITKTRTITPNEWTLLQFRMLSQPAPIEGLPSPIWKSSYEKIIDERKITRYLNSVLYLGSRLFMIVITPINRIIDMLGFGESFLIEMKEAK